jgi:hypothetical protein
MGDEKTLTDSSPHVGHAMAGVAVPIGRLTSISPCWSQRYAYVATALVASARIRCPVDDLPVPGSLALADMRVKG